MGDNGRGWEDGRDVVFHFRCFDCGNVMPRGGLTIAAKYVRGEFHAGFAICSPKDNFCRKQGVAIAAGRLTTAPELAAKFREQLEELDEEASAATAAAVELEVKVLANANTHPDESTIAATIKAAKEFREQAEAAAAAAKELEAKLAKLTETAAAIELPEYADWDILRTRCFHAAMTRTKISPKVRRFLEDHLMCDNLLARRIRARRTRG